MAKKKPISDTEIRSITDAEIRNSMAYMSGRLSEMRRRNEYYYLAEAKGDLAPPAIDGRSRVVSTDVADTVNAMLPHLINVFAGSDHAVEFTPTREEDEQGAAHATDYVNHVFYSQNPGMLLLHTWFKDALLQKGGVLKVYWNSDIEDLREEYRAMTDVELAMLLQDENVEPTEHTAYADEMGQTLHDLTVKRRRTGRVSIEAVPPEEFLVSRRATLLKFRDEVPFVAHRVERTISQLKARGYKNVDKISSDDSAAGNSERIERRAWDDEMAYAQNTGQENIAPENRVVWITECYIKLDYNGDGIAEWRKIVRAGNEILENEEVDGHPFVFITPEPLPHRLFGLCPADNAIQVQTTKTSLMRALLDNAYLQVNGRTIAVDGQVNIDDLLTSRPGGVVRAKSISAVAPLPQGMSDASTTASLLEQMEVWKENRTGFTRYSQGSDSNSLNKTATGINILTNRSDERMDLIARVFAETGVKDLFRLILKLVSQNQDQQAMIRVGGSWVNIDPREWKNQFDFSVNVGLGNGNKDQIVQHLLMLGQTMERAMPLGIVTPKNVFNAMKKMTQALGFKQPELFVTDPDTIPPQPPQPDPNMLKLQLEQQKLQVDAETAQKGLQIDVAKAATDHQRALQEAQAQQELEVIKLQSQRDIEELKARLKAEADLQAAQMKFEQEMRIKQLEIEAEMQRILLENEIKLKIAEISAAATERSAAYGAQTQAMAQADKENERKAKESEPKQPDIGQIALAEAIQGMSAVMGTINKPKRVVRGADGKVEGIE